MPVSDGSLSKENERERMRLVAKLKTVAHWVVVHAELGKDGVARHLLWHAGGCGEYDHYFEVRKSGELLLKTRDAISAVDRFLDEVNAARELRLPDTQTGNDKDVPTASSAAPPTR